VKSTEKLYRIFSMHFFEVFLRRHTFLKEKDTFMGCKKPNVWVNMWYELERPGIQYWIFHTQNKTKQNKQTTKHYFVMILCLLPDRKSVV
jgi:hypothetical protein